MQIQEAQKHTGHTDPDPDAVRILNTGAYSAVPIFFFSDSKELKKLVRQENNI